MITINLLPQEYRRRDRTSPKILGAILGGVVVVCSSAGFLGYRWFGVVNEAEAEAARLEENLRNLEQSASYDDELIKEAAEYQKRSDTIQQISESRVLWTRKLDQLIDVVNNDGDTERHQVWFSNLQIRPGDGKRGPTMVMRGASASDQFSRVANFLDDVQRHELYRDFRQVSPPGGRVVIDAKKFPQETVDFPFELVMKPPKALDRRGHGSAAAQPPAQKPAETAPNPGK